MRARVLLSILVLIAVGLAGCQEDPKDDDLDQLLNSFETGTGWLIQVALVDRFVAYRVYSDPQEFDTDGDGISDFEEFRQGTDPSKADTDEDGLTDCQELLTRNLDQCDVDFPGPFDLPYPTDPSRADSDGGVGRYYHNGPGYTDETGTLVNGIEWGDGLTDGEEVLGYLVTLPDGSTRMTTSDPLDPDTDGDFLHDGEEAKVYGSDPLATDTDADGCVDGRDPLPARNERLNPGLRSFTLRKDQDATGGADLRLSVSVAGVTRTVPASGSISVSKDQAEDLSGRWTDAVRPAACDSSALDPWVLLQIQAEDVDGTSVESMDIYSLAGNPDPTEGWVSYVWWNLQEDRFSFVEDLGDSMVAPLTWKGQDGELVFAPFLE